MGESDVEDFRQILAATNAEIGLNLSESELLAMIVLALGRHWKRLKATGGRLHLPLEFEGGGSAARAAVLEYPPQQDAGLMVAEGAPPGSANGGIAGPSSDAPQAAGPKSKTGRARPAPALSGPAQQPTG